MTLFGISAATFAAGEVQLLSARSNLCTGCPGGLNVTANIEVKNIAYAKIVGIHYKNGSGTWANQNGSYFMTSSGGKEVWNISNWGVTENFAAYYTVNGTTYWDNNGGKNYNLSKVSDDAVLGYPAIKDPQGGWGNSAITGDILVKNLGTGKTVKVVYTENNWAVTKNAYATYKKTMPSGVEVWSFSLPTAATITPANVQFAFNYTWTGGSAWDNNFGRNYGIHSQMFIAPR